MVHGHVFYSYLLGYSYCTVWPKRVEQDKCATPSIYEMQLKDTLYLLERVPLNQPRKISHARSGGRERQIKNGKPIKRRPRRFRRAPENFGKISVNLLKTISGSYRQDNTQIRGGSKKKADKVIEIEGNEAVFCSQYAPRTGQVLPRKEYGCYNCV